MTELAWNHFDEFFQMLWGKTPFAWQRELAQRVLHGNGAPWPEVIALPTASGKTACLDIAVFALAAAALNTPQTEPLQAARRIFFAVDRRVIVDEVFERARKLAYALANADSGVVKTVADALRTLAGSDHPLACFQLRGGMYRSDAWARSPAQPAIIATTVDQLGSRLLFRAYGRSFKAWPIQAGLAGNDALIFLDEAHCARPFMQTLGAVAKYRAWAEASLATPFQAVLMSATPPSEFNDVFGDHSSETRTPGHPLGDRQLASKPARLHIAKKAKGANAIDELAVELVKRADELIAGRPLACVIFVNRVATARSVFRRLKQGKYAEDVVLLTGRMRPFDKDDTVAEQLTPLASANSSGRLLPRPQIVVTTQTLEVGADLDFDLLVTECAGLDALRQRFGRLNRMGRLIDRRDSNGRPIGARAVIVIRADQAEKLDDDPVYGTALSSTWQWLVQQGGESQEVDFGIAELDLRLPPDAARTELNPVFEPAPVMLPAHVDCWAQTAPQPAPTPECAVFLHGLGKGSADVLVCWRADIKLDAAVERLAYEADKSKEILTLCPPATPECVAVPIHRMRQWLAGVDMADASADIESPTEEVVEVKPQVTQRRVVRWRGRDEMVIIECRPAYGRAEWGEVCANGDWRPLTEREALHPGDVIVIPADLGAWQELADLTPRHDGVAPILDYGDRAYTAMRGKALLRLHPAVLECWPKSGADAIRDLVLSASMRLEEDTETYLSELKAVLARIGDDTEMPTWLRCSAASLSGESERNFKRCVELHPRDGLLLRGSRFVPRDVRGDAVDLFSDEDDASSSSGSRAIHLDRHLQGVAAYAAGFANACRLPPPIAGAVTLAALLHDLGKADPRFQSLLRGGRPAPRGEWLAKSNELPQGRSAHQVARKAAGYPDGTRHELLSVTLAESAPELLPDEPILRDLVLHLIAAHHGHCRPFAPVATDVSDAEVEIEFDALGDFSRPRFRAPLAHMLERLDSGVADRFWRLTRHFGWWGLAWLEAIVRLADHRRSEAEAAGEVPEDEVHE